MITYYINPETVPIDEVTQWDEILEAISGNVTRWVAYAKRNEMILILAPLMRRRYEVHAGYLNKHTHVNHIEITEFKQLKAVYLKNQVLVG